MEKVYVVYSKSKIHGVYTTEVQANIVLRHLYDKAGVNNGGIPRKFYYIKEIEVNK